ncbi:MAG: IS110 family transposase, partial [Egibacteraceae bacterium]
ARYHRLIVAEHKHHVSALCHLAATLASRIAACWRNGERYVLRDVDGTEITEADGRKICAERYAIPPEVRQARRRICTAKRHKQRTDRRGKESTKAAPAAGPSQDKL